jgi:hypothetical protein
MNCRDCEDEIDLGRWSLGYRLCLFCGEQYAQMERESWTVIQEYTKGNYQFVTADAAKQTLRQTNPKELRA